MTSICGIRLMVRRAANVTIHVIPDDAFDLSDGRSQYESFEKGWLARWLAR
jgi:hypothetical protein